MVKKKIVIGETEKKILKILYKHPFSEEKVLRKILKRKSPIHQELSRLRSKRYISTARTDQPNKPSSYYLTQKGLLHFKKEEILKEKLKELFEHISYLEIQDVAYNNPLMIDGLRQKYPHLTFSKNEWEEKAEIFLEDIEEEHGEYAIYPDDDGIEHDLSWEPDEMVMPIQLESLIIKHSGNRDTYTWEKFKREFLKWENACEMSAILDKSLDEYTGQEPRINNFMEEVFNRNIINEKKIKGTEKDLLELEEFID